MNKMLSYKKALEVLHHHYGCEESIYIKTRRFVSVRGNAREDDREYSKTVEQLSRILDFSNHTEGVVHKALQTARSSLALIIVMNGLSDEEI